MTKVEAKISEFAHFKRPPYFGLQRTSFLLCFATMNFRELLHALTASVVCYIIWMPPHDKTLYFYCTDYLLFCSQWHQNHICLIDKLAHVNGINLRQLHLVDNNEIKNEGLGEFSQGLCRKHDYWCNKCNQNFIIGKHLCYSFFPLYHKLFCNHLMSSIHNSLSKWK